MANIYRIQLYSLATGQTVETAGGQVAVHEPYADGAARIGLTDATGGPLSQPVALTRGGCEFRTADAVKEVDLYILTPTKHWIIRRGIKPGLTELRYDDTARQTTIAVPFSMNDMTAGAVFDTGFDLPADMLFDPPAYLDIVTADAGKTVDVGTLASETGGDADRFIAGASTAKTGVVAAAKADSHVTDGTAKSIVVMPAAGSSTMAGIAYLPVKIA